MFAFALFFYIFYTGGCQDHQKEFNDTRCLGNFDFNI